MLAIKVTTVISPPLSTLHTELVYSGRVMKTGRSVIDYKVVAGCTIHVMNIKPKKREKAI